MSKQSIDVVRREGCTKCDLPVVIAERLHVNNHLYHRTCFTCSHCHTQLTIASFCETNIENQFCCERCPDEESSDYSIPHSTSDEEKLEHDSYSNIFETALEDTNDVILNKHYTLKSDRSDSFTQARSHFIASQLEDTMGALDLPPHSTINEPPDLLKFVKKSEDLDLVDHIKNSVVNDSDSIDNSSLGSNVVNSNLSDSDRNQPETANNFLEIFTKECDENNGDVIVTDTISDSYKHDSDASVIVLEDTIITVSSEDNSNPFYDISDENIEDYPDDLNPFGDDNDKKASLNPFSSDDDEVVDVPLVRKRIPVRGIGVDNSFLNKMYEKQENNKPLPLPRLDRTSQGVTPTPTPRKSGLHASSVFGSNTSLSSVQSGLEQGRRRKKPAPQPPMTLSPQDSTQSSLTSTPSAQHSPKLPRSRKSKKAPLPPITSTPFVIDNEPPHFLSTTFDHLEINTLGMDITKVEKEKVFKDEVNRIRQSQNLDTSNVNTHRRSKGPAPSRPIAQKRSIKPSPFLEIKHELDVIEIQMQGLEKQGARLEELIREKCEGPEVEADQAITPEVDNLILELFEIVNEKNALFRRQTELMYMRRQHRLEEEHAELEYEIRCLLLVPEPKKTDTDKTREEELIKRLFDVVEQRNEIIECLDKDRIRETEEDNSITNELTTYSSKSTLVIESTPMKKKHKKFKTKPAKKLDIDKDIDESEASPKKEKKKKKFNIF